MVSLAAWQRGLDATLTVASQRGLPIWLCKQSSEARGSLRLGVVTTMAHTLAGIGRANGGVVSGGMEAIAMVNILIMGHGAIPIILTAMDGGDNLAAPTPYHGVPGAYDAVQQDAWALGTQAAMHHSAVHHP